MTTFPVRSTWLRMLPWATQALFRGSMAQRVGVPSTLAVERLPITPPSRIQVCSIRAPASWKVKESSLSCLAQLRAWEAASQPWARRSWDRHNRIPALARAMRIDDFLTDSSAG